MGCFYVVAENNHNFPGYLTTTLDVGGPQYVPAVYPTSPSQPSPPLHTSSPPLNSPSLASSLSSSLSSPTLSQAASMLSSNMPLDINNLTPRQLNAALSMFQSNKLVAMETQLLQNTNALLSSQNDFLSSPAASSLLNAVTNSLLTNNNSLSASSFMNFLPMKMDLKPTIDALARQVSFKIKEKLLKTYAN